MKRTSDVELVLHEWLAGDGDIAPDRVLEVVADRIAVQRQRRTWRLQRRLTMSPALKYGTAAAAVLVVAVAGYSLLPKGPSYGSAPTPSPTPSAQPTATTTPAPSAGATFPPTAAIHDGPLVSGRYLLQPFSDQPSLRLTADLPTGWDGFAPVGAIGPRGPEGPDGISFSMMRPEGLFSDPCHWDLDGTGNPDQPGDVQVGPGMVDLEHGLFANTSYEADDPAWADFPVPSEGLGETAGHAMDVRLPERLELATCDRDTEGQSRYYVFSGPYAGLYAQGDGNIWTLGLVEVGGTRLIAVLSYFAGTPPADLAAGQAIMKSLDFKP